MSETVFNRGSIPALEKMLYFTRERAKAIHNNIANWDTPGYKAIDAPQSEFMASLLKAMKEQNTTGIFNFEGTDQIKPKIGGGLSVEFVPSQDTGAVNAYGNNVDIDKEMAKLSRNAMMHNFVANLITQQFSLLRSAISERIT